MRTPVLSFSSYHTNINSKELNFQKILSNPILIDAILLASPTLHKQILRWQKGELTSNKQIEKLKLSILKYYTRMSSRCTPFGLFAACSNGSFVKDKIDEFPIVDSDIVKITKFDNTFLSLLINELLKNNSIKEQILFYPNTSLYKIGNHFRYIEYKIENSKRKYSLEGFSNNTDIKSILKYFKNGKKISEVADKIGNNENPKEEVIEFINTLISNQILISELEITISGENTFLKILEIIENTLKSTKLFRNLKRLYNLIIDLDKNQDLLINHYNEIIAIAEEIIPQLNSKFLLHTDSYRSASPFFLNKNIKKQLNNAFFLFNKMTLPSVNRNLVIFKEKFLKRFDQSEVPLNLVLDFETGIGYGTDIVNEDSFLTILQGSKRKKRYKNIVWSDTDSIMQNKLIEAIKNGKKTIKLDEKDFFDFQTNFEDLPDTTSSIIEIYNIENEQQLFINSIGGSSAINLLGRFSHGDKKLSSTISKIKFLEDQMNQEEILAEIIHLPEASTGNILHRSFQRDYEIPYLGKSSLAYNFQIPLDDILVSIKNDEIILKSKKLNKIINPRLSNAHNYKNSNLPIYNFLCDLQYQNKRPYIGFSWNTIFSEYQFLPRVVFENIIFSKARWLIKISDFKKLFLGDDSIINVRNWQKSNTIPDYVDLVEGDNKLLINFNNEYSIKMLFDAVKTKKQFILEEFLFQNSKMISDSLGNNYCNQFIVSFFNKNKYEKR